MQEIVLSIFFSNFHVVGVALYGVSNILRLRSTEIFHFGGHNSGFLQLDPSPIGRKIFFSISNIIYTTRFEI